MTSEPYRPLEGIRVVELTAGVPGAYCAKQFAYWGADVLALEPSGGSPLRRRQPLVAGADGAPKSLLWEYLSLGKRRATLKISGPRARESLSARLEEADVLVCDWRRSRLAAAGLAPESLVEEFPRLVFLSVTPFGLDGPYAELAAEDLTVQAVCGYVSLNGLPGREPLKGPANVVPFACGVSAFVGGLAALHERGRSGRGQVVEASDLESIASLIVYLRTEYSGGPFQRQGGPVAGTWGYARCRDGWVSFSPFPEQGWSHFLAAMGIADADVPEALRAQEGRRDRRAVWQFVESHTRDRPSLEVFRSLSTLGTVTGIAQSPLDLLRCEHLAARGFFRPAYVEGLGRLTVPGPPAQVHPTLQAQTAEGEEALRTPEARQAAPGVAGRTASSPSRGARPLRPPLDGVRIVDLTQAWIGPYATQLLADLGAHVVKVESPRRPDVWRGIEGRPDARGLVNPDAHPWNTNANFNSVNRNKLGLALDLDGSKGKDLLLRLVAGADLVMENFTPRVMDNFGLGFEALRAVKPDLVMVSFAGFGKSGPYRDFKTNGAATEGNGGWDVFSGYAGGPPSMMGIMQADAITGLHMAAVALLGLIHGRRTGQGQRVDGSMYEAAATYVGEEVMLASLTGADSSGRRGNRHQDMAPHGVFACAGEDCWLAVAVRDDDDWQALVALAGDEVPGLREARFETFASRLEAAEAVEALLSEWTRRRAPEEAARALLSAGIPAARVQNTQEALRDVHLVARDWFKTMTHPDMGSHKQNGFNWRFSRTPCVCVTPSPRLGEHSREVLKAELGLSDSEVEALFDAGISGYVFARPAEAAAGG